MSLISLLSQPCSSRFASSLLTSLQRSTQSRSFVSTPRRRNDKDAQPQTPASETIELSSPAAYISESNDPWFNLSYEDWLLRNTPRNQPVLFIYRNTPCVVIGRNQNPWKETTPRDLVKWDIPLIRRRSGGGTVFHDMGNTNFSIILPRLLFTRAHGAELVAKAVRGLGVEGCTVNSRNDVIIRDGEKELKIGPSVKLWEYMLMIYVSGSAYKIIQHRAYHHGTMLISSSLGELGKALKTSSPNIETKGIPSFRSPVTTLNTYLSPNKPQIDHDSFTRAVTSEFRRVYEIPNTPPMEITYVNEDDVTEKKIWDGVEEMKTWEWEYGSSPEFSNQIEGELSFGSLSVSLTARHGLITAFIFHLNPPLHTSAENTKVKQDYLDTLALSLVGRRYESLEGAEGAIPHDKDPALKEIHSEVVDWLRRAM